MKLNTENQAHFDAALSTFMDEVSDLYADTTDNGLSPAYLERLKTRLTEAVTTTWAEALSPWIATDARDCFIREARAHGYKVRPYSGRGMFGVFCPAIHIDNELEASFFTNTPILDTQGLGYVAYCR